MYANCIVSNIEFFRPGPLPRRKMVDLFVLRVSFVAFSAYKKNLFCCYCTLCPAEVIGHRCFRHAVCIMHVDCVSFSEMRAAKSSFAFMTGRQAGVWFNTFRETVVACDTRGARIERAMHGRSVRVYLQRNDGDKGTSLVAAVTLIDFSLKLNTETRFVFG